MNGKPSLWFLLWALLATGCGPSDELGRLPSTGPVEGSFYVSSYFSPSGHMGDGAVAGHVFVDINEQCKERPEGANGDCYRFTYDPGQELWAGVYWAYPANNWGTRPGKTVIGPYTRVRFYAAVDPSSIIPGDTGVGVDFFAGGIRSMESGLPFEDNFSRTGKFVSVGTDFQQFTLEFLDQPSKVIGAFGWALNYPTMTDPAMWPTSILYIDDVIWE
jgi:hypothetical protein